MHKSSAFVLNTVHVHYSSAPGSNLIIEYLYKKVLPLHGLYLYGTQTVKLSRIHVILSVGLYVAAMIRDYLDARIHDPDPLLNFQSGS